MRPVRHIQYIIATIALLITSTGWSQEGKSAFDFLNLPTSSHAYTLGGTNISIIDEDVNLIHQNPALLGPESHLQLGLNYMKYVGGINLGGATFAHRAGRHGAWAVGMQYYGYGSMKSADETGFITGEFSPKDIVLNGIYSHDFTLRLRGGINGKVIYSSYEQYTSWALAVDLGLNYYNADKDLSLSLVARNLGGQVKRYNNTFERMPIDVQLGYTQSFAHAPIRISVTACHLTRWNLPYLTIENNSQNGNSSITENSVGNAAKRFGENLFRHLIFGIEFLPTDRIYIGLGYNYKTRTDMKTEKRNILSGFSIGGGIKVRMFGLGVALAQQHTGATTLLINLSTNLYEFKK